MKSVPGFISNRQDFQKPTTERHRSRVELCKSAYPFFHGRLINSLLNEVHLKVNKPLPLKRITFKSIGYQAQPEPKQLKGSWQVFAPCEHADYSGCVLFSKIAGLSSIEDKKAAILALKKLIQIAAMGQPITAHYDKKQCHELHKFKYQGKDRVIRRIHHGGDLNVSTIDKEFADLCNSIWEDENVIFEAKAQDVAIVLASAVQEAGLSSAALAEQLNWKRSRVSKVLTGSSNLTLKTIFQVCRAIGLEFDVILRKAHQQSEVVDPEKHQAMQQEAVNNLYKSRQLLHASTELHRKVSQSALATRNYTREEARMKLVA